MGRTQVDTEQIREVQRNDLDTTTSGQAVVAKALSTEGVTHTSTGADSGTGDVTLKLDVNGLTEDTSPDIAADFVATYDASAGTHKKVKVNKLGATIIQSVGITVDGGGSVVTTGTKGRTQVNFTGTLLGVTLLAKESGSVEFGITKGTFADFPSSMTSIIGSNKPELVSAQKAEITLDGGWTTSITAGDVLVFGIAGTPATITQVTLIMHYKQG